MEKNRVDFSMHSWFICIPVHSSDIWALGSNQKSYLSYSNAQMLLF